MSSIVRQHLTQAERNLRLAEATNIASRRDAHLAISQHHIQQAYTVWAEG